MTGFFHRVPEVLVIDDDPLFRFLVVDALERLKVSVREAADGQAALTLLKGAVFDLILLDLNMPGMSGLQFLERVCPETRAKTAVLTAEIGDEGQRLKELGVKEILIKPCPRMLLDVLKPHITRKYYQRGTEILARATRVDSQLLAGA